MKTVFLFCSLLLTLHLYSQPTIECAANAGPDKIICYNSSTGLILNTQPSNDYLQVEWTYMGADPLVHVVNPSSLSTPVTYAGGNVWPPNTTYTFRFTVKCKDYNNDGVYDTPFDDMVVTVKDDVTQPQIIEPDGTQDGEVRVCASTALNVTPPAPGEKAKVMISSYNNDNRVIHSLDTANGILYLQRKNLDAKGDCDYTVTYKLTNDGCERSASVDVYFVRPFDPDSNGIINGRVSSGCPSCGDILDLDGDFPGCGGSGKWTLVSALSDGTMTYLSQDSSRGSAKVKVSTPGNYTFVYTVDNIAPCPSSTDTVTCSVLALAPINLGPNRVLLFCDNIIPKDTFHITLPNYPNAVYNWWVVQNALQGITISDPHSYASDIIFEQPVDISSYAVQVRIQAFKLYIDADCDGKDYEEYVFPPGNTPQQNWALYLSIKQTPGLCWKECKSQTEIEFNGAPVLAELHEDVNFLCGTQGAQNVVLQNYFTVANTSYTAYVTVESQPQGGNLGNITTSSSLSLIAGDYRFKIELVVEAAGNQSCTKVIYINIRVREPQPVTAGTDQIKCYNEPIRLNGNLPYSGGITGTWTQVNCSPCTITFADPTDRNTQIFLTGVDPNSLPVTLYFEWSFGNEDPSCGTSDTTAVTVNPCVVPCNREVSVDHECLDDKIILTLLDGNDAIVDASVYDITWTLLPGGTQTGNPVSVPNTGSPVNYTVQVVLNFQDSILCNFQASGSLACKTPPSGCGITVLEMCDSCGNVIVKAVDSLGNIVLPVNFEHEFRWRVFGDGPNDLSYMSKQGNPITVNPNACYELTYDHFTYAPNVPHVPGTGTLCRYEMPKQCVSIHCPEPNCEDFNFYIAGCGDDKDVNLGLTFPSNCYNVTNGLWGTLGVFDAATNQPVDSNSVHIVWKNNSGTGTYITGNLLSINSVTITQKDGDGCCIWEDKYSPTCMCTCEPTGLQCEQPIVKYCYENGTVSYVPGIPRIAWVNVPGATSYILEINFDAIGEEGCCRQPSGSGIVYDTVSSSPWEIPLSWHCFTIRVKAVNPNALCPQTDWSDPYLYCEGVCSPVIITCGCCHGRSNEGYSLPDVVLPEAEVLSYLNTLPNQNFSTLEEALIFTGWSQLAKAEFSIFPNPANQALTIRRKGATAGHYFIRMTDLLNRECRAAELSDQTETTLEIGNLPPGVYLVQIRNSNGGLQRVEKVLIMRQ